MSGKDFREVGRHIVRDGSETARNNVTRWFVRLSACSLTRGGFGIQPEVFNILVDSQALGCLDVVARLRGLCALELRRRKPK